MIVAALVALLLPAGALADLVFYSVRMGRIPTDAATGSDPSGHES